MECLCPYCIADSSAAEKFDGEFQDASSCDKVDDPAKTEELTKRTPGCIGWHTAVTAALSEVTKDEQ